MKKGFVFVTAIAIIVSLVACSFEPETVTGLELEKSSYLISTINLDSMRNPLQVKVKNVYPNTVPNKKVSFELIDAEIADDVTGKDVTYEYTVLDDVLTGTYKWSDFVEVDRSGVLSFKENTTEVLKNVHDTFVIRVKSIENPSVYADAKFSLNYDIPSTVEVKLKRDVYDVDATKDIELTTGEKLDVSLIFNENEYSEVQFAYVDEEGKVVDLVLQKKDDDTKYYAISTVAELYPETMEYKALATDVTGSTLVIKNCEETELARFTTFINRINDAKELKAFLADNSLTYTAGSREEQLKNAKEGWLLSDVSVSAINSEATVAKTLNTNEYDITFEHAAGSSEFTTALNLGSSVGLTINANNSVISLENNTIDATLVNAGAKSLTINGGTFSATTHKANSKAVTIKSSGTVKIDNSSIKASAFDTATGVNGEAVGVEAYNTVNCGEYNNVTVEATGKNATAVEVNKSKISKGSFVADALEKAIALETNGSVEVSEIKLEAKAKEAIAINDIADGLKFKEGTTASELSATGTEKAFGIKTVDSADISSVKLKVSSDKEAVGIYIDAASNDDVVIDNVAESTVSGKVAIGIYNYKAKSTTLDNVVLSVVGKKIDNNILEFKDTELTYAVAGIINMSSLSVTGPLDLDVESTNDLATTKDYYGIYNTVDGQIVFAAENDATFNVNVNVDVQNGGACALKNVGKISFTNISGVFTANRTNEVIGASQMTAYALDNTDNTNLGITVKGGTLQFIAKSHNSTSGKDLENNVGYMFKEKLGTEEGTGFVTISVEPYEN